MILPVAWISPSKLYLNKQLKHTFWKNPLRNSVEKIINVITLSKKNHTHFARSFIKKNGHLLWD